MSEPVKITSVEKVKDPRRVEAGKKLGAISRQAKERKQANETSEAKQARQARSEASDIPCVELSSIAAVFVVSVVVGGIVLHYKSSQSKEVSRDRQDKSSPKRELNREDREEKSPAPKRELDTLG